MREALDWLRDALVPRFEEKGIALFHNPWITRNNYIDVILDRSPASVEGFLERHARHPLSDQEKVQALKLLELQRHAMLMYTSCGWFFDELSGIETAQVIQYAGRALQLSERLFGDGLEPEFLSRLEKAKSNIPEHRDGRLIYEKFVRPARVDLQKVGAHYAVSSLFQDYGEQTRIYCYEISRDDHKVMQAGKVRLDLGRVKITSQITRESDLLTFGVVHLGDHNVSGGIRTYQGDAAYQALVKEVDGAFAIGDLPELIRVVDKNFGFGIYSLKLLFRDQQRRILRLILESTLADAETLYRRFYEEHAVLIRFVTELGLPLPRRLTLAAEFVLNADLQRAFEASELDRERIDQLLAEARRAGITLDSARLEFALRRKLEQLANALGEQPEDLTRVQSVESVLDLASILPFELNLWKPQNIYYELLQNPYPKFRALASSNEEAKEWVLHFTALGDKLRVRVPSLDGDVSG